MTTDELQDELKAKDGRIAELKEELEKANELITNMVEHIRDRDQTIDDWIEAFDMVPTGKNEWSFPTGLRDQYDEIQEKYDNLLRRWNKFVARFNARVAPRNIGRPIDASEAQQAQVLKYRKAGQSLRSIAEDMNLSLRTVRTITEKANGTDRATAARLERIAPDKIANKIHKTKKAARAALPRRINASLKEGQELLKQAKGLK